MTEIKDPNGITQMSDWLAAIAPDLQLLDDINAGERRLLEKADIYLPKDKYETDEGYATRLRRASLKNFLLKIKRVAVSTVLRKPIQVQGDDSFTSFVSSDGLDIQLFARNLLDAAWLEGFALVFTDYPNTTDASNLAEEKRRGYKPYWQIIRRSQLLEVRTEMRTQMVGDRPVYSSVISYLRFKTHEMTEAGIEPVVMVYELGEENLLWEQWALRGDDKEKEWVQIDNGVAMIPFIPVSALYIEQEGFCQASMPLLETASLNKQHFAVNSGKYNLLGILGNPLLIFTGVDLSTESMSKSQNIGLAFESPDSDAKYVTLDPAVIAPVETALEKIEHHLLNGAIQIFEQKNMAETEASKAMDREQSYSLLSLSAQSLESCLNQALAHASAYTSTEPATVMVNKDFILNNIDPTAFNAWLQGWLSNAYTQETFLRKLEASGFFEGIDEFDLESELERTA